MRKWIITSVLACVVLITQARSAGNKSTSYGKKTATKTSTSSNTARGTKSSTSGMVQVIGYGSRTKGTNSSAMKC